MSAVERAPNSVGVIGTTLAHGLLLGGLVVAAHRGEQSSTISYAVTLLAAPAPSASPTRLPEAPATKQPEKTIPTKAASKPKKADPKKPEVKQAPSKQPEARVAPKTSAPKTTEVPAAGETPSTGQDALTRTFPGLNFPYPEYLNNIINKIYQRFESDPTWGPGLVATVGFTIHRDGSVTDIVMLKQSGSYAFNTAAKSAVRSAADAKLFGPLPAAWPSDELPISFSFSPRKP